MKRTVIFIGLILIILSGFAEAGDTVPAKPLETPEPIYPLMEYYKKLEASVSLEFKVDKRGLTKDVKVIKGPEAFHESAVECIEEWKFEPAEREGRPVKSNKTATLIYRVEKQWDESIPSILDYEGIGADLKAPEKVKHRQPIYPPLARKARAEGYIYLHTIIGKNGRIIDIKFMDIMISNHRCPHKRSAIPEMRRKKSCIKTLKEEFLKASVNAVEQWKYQPLEINGVKSPCFYTINIKFEL